MVYFIHFPFQSDASYLSKKAGLKNYQNFNEENLTKLVLAVKSGNLIYVISKSAIDIKEKNSKKKADGKTRLCDSTEEIFASMLDEFAKWRMPLDRVDS